MISLPGMYSKEITQRGWNGYGWWPTQTPFTMPEHRSHPCWDLGSQQLTPSPSWLARELMCPPLPHRAVLSPKLTQVSLPQEEITSVLQLTLQSTPLDQPQANQESIFAHLLPLMLRSPHSCPPQACAQEITCTWTPGQALLMGNLTSDTGESYTQGKGLL